MFLLLIHYFTPWPWPLTFDLEHLPVTWWNSVPNLNAIEQSAVELLRFQCLILWPWTYFKCYARLWDILCQVWPSANCPCLNYSVFWCWYVMSSCDLDLWLVDRESSWSHRTSSVTWSKSARNLSEIEQSAIKLWIILRIFAHVISRCDLDVWPLNLELLQHFGCHVFKLCATFERNRIIHGCVIDDLARFCRAILWVGHWFSGVRGLINCNKLGKT